MTRKVKKLNEDDSIQSPFFSGWDQIGCFFFPVERYSLRKLYVSFLVFSPFYDFTANLCFFSRYGVSFTRTEKLGFFLFFASCTSAEIRVLQLLIRERWEHFLCVCTEQNICGFFMSIAIRFFFNAERNLGFFMRRAELLWDIQAHNYLGLLCIEKFAFLLIKESRFGVLLTQ